MITKLKNDDCCRAYIFMFISLLFIVITYAYDGRYLMGSDYANTAILADIMNREHELFISRNFYYLTEISILGMHIPLRIGLLIFNDWHYARTFTCFILFFLLELSYLALCKIGNFGKYAIYCGTVMMFPFSVAYNDWTALGLVYIQHTIKALVIIDIILFVSNSRKNKINYIVMFGGFLLSLINGMEGLRLVFFLYLPLVLTEGGGYTALYDYY